MEWAWLTVALPAAAFVVIVVAGRWLPKDGAPVAVAAIAGAFGLFWFVLARFLPAAPGPHGFSITWLEADTTRLTLGTLIDPLSVVMLGLVTFVALAVQVYSLEYMRHEARFGWYFAAHSLFAASMLAVVLADNFLFFYIAWELVGLCSYLLIGFFYERRSAAEAAKKAFVTTRIGDVGLLIGIVLLFKETGTFNMQAIFQQVSQGGLSEGVVTAAAILIFLGAMGKSAQFPLHVWLPDAMEGPTPVSALIHAATMVAAGVYLVARAFPLFEAAPVAQLLVASIGLLTAIMAATMALVMTDLKRVLAYSTISHLGFMMLALGAGSVTAAIFHLLAHGFSKALLFLGAGSVTHSTGASDIRNMGGLARRMPVTAAAFAVGALALGGIFPLSGFFSKDEVLLAVLQHRSPVFLALALLAALLSALYMARVWFRVFLGPLKAEHAHAHESPPLMTVPLIALALLALLGGLLALPLGGSYQGFGSFLYGGEPEPFHLNGVLAAGSLLLAVAGFYLAWRAYVQKRLDTGALLRRFPGVYQVWSHKYYLDDLYQWGINRVVLALSKLVSLFDRVVVNDVGVNSAGHSVALSGQRLRYHITGKLYNYALGMALGVVAVALVWIFIIARL